LKSTPLRLGFIGGAIDSAVGTTHKISSQLDNRWSLDAACFSSHEESNILTAKQWGLDSDHVYSSYQELLEAEKDRLDAIAVLTPTPSHTDIVIAAIENGYPVICEKALAISSSEARLIKNAVNDNQGFLAVTYNYTGYPMIRELRSIIMDGLFGKLHQIHIEMPQEGFLRLDKGNNKPTPQAWRLKDYAIPTLSLDLGVHLHQMIHFLSGERPIELIARNNNYGFFDDIVDNTMCMARYSGNLDCQLWFGKTALGNSNGLRVRVYGELGSAEWYQMQPETLTLHDNKGRKSILERSCVDLKIANDARYNRFKAGHPAGFIEAFANLYTDIADCLQMHNSDIKNHSPWVFGVDTALEGLLMLEGMTKSANNKQWEVIHH